MKKLFAVSIFICSFYGIYAQLIINELSQGPSGTKEYVELLVTGSPVCGGANTVDLRGWIIDDNNSWHGAGSGTGIAAGHVRFPYITQWANVKIGTLILIFNDADISPAVASLTVDTNDSNSDCVYIIPISSSVLEKNVTLPVSNGSMTTYNIGGTIYNTTGTWTCLGMANTADAFHTVSPADYATPYHSIGWGIDTAQLNVYFNSSQGGKVIYMSNGVNNDPFNAANYVDTSSATEETPGAPNNQTNAAWIRFMNNNCAQFVPPVVTFNIPSTLTCIQTTAIITATSPSQGATYHWSNGILGANDTVSVAGYYSLTVTDVAGVCSTTDSVNVMQNNASPIVSIAESSSLSCSSGNDTLTANSVASGATYHWTTGITASFIVVSVSGNYSVTATDPANGCSASSTISVNSSSGISISISSANTTCGNNNGSATVSLISGTAQSYAWSNGGSTSTISNLAPGLYRVTVDAGGGCVAVDSITINTSGGNSVIITTDRNVMCSGDSAIICAPVSYSSYIWNTGENTPCIRAKLAGNYYVTVTDNGNCTASSNHIGINVYPLPPVSISINGDTLTAYNAVTYQWYKDNTLIPNATSSVYIASQGGDYTVAVTDTNGCRAVSTKVTLITGIKELIEIDEIKIYPNPSQSGIYELEIGNDFIGRTFEIFDNNGRIVYRSVFNSVHSEVCLNLSSGIYFIKVNSGRESLTRKLVRL